MCFFPQKLQSNFLFIYFFFLAKFNLNRGDNFKGWFKKIEPEGIDTQESMTSKRFEGIFLVC